MLSLGDYVNRKGTTHPTGVIEALNDVYAWVLWGVADKRVYREEIPRDALVVITHKIVTQDEIVAREIEESRVD